MQPLLSAVPVMSVTAIFYAWNLYRHDLLERRRRQLIERRRRQLCKRVAYMLWVASDYAA